MNYLSLSFDVLSLEALSWVIISLRKDEMAPKEKSINSRIKEAFAYKLSSQKWEKLVDCIES